MPGWTWPPSGSTPSWRHVPFRSRIERHDAAPVPVPDQLPQGRRAETASTQEAFGRIMGELARSDLPLAARIVTTSPDVTVSTSLGGWVGRRERVQPPRARGRLPRRAGALADALAREPRPGQHLELGIAENNLFLNLASLGLAHELFGARLLPVGTLYDPFIARGLDALNYACYQDARFLLVATPSGITLAPEGGAHQSIGTPADRHQPARPDLVRAGLSPTRSRSCCAGRSSTCRRRTAARSICG